MPSPKWKLVVDIGDVEEPASVASAAVAAASTAASAPASSAAAAALAAASQAAQQQPEQQVDSDFGFMSPDVAPTITASNATMAQPSAPEPGKRDSRIDEVIVLLGEFMPSDQNAPAANYLSGFMSLRLLLLRQTSNPEDEELVRTILDSYSSYASGGRDRGDIAMMLARDYIFLSQQQQSQSAFLGLSQNGMATSVGPGATAPAASSGNLSLFGLPSISSSLQNSPALTPIPAPGIIDSMSIVSNN